MSKTQKDTQTVTINDVDYNVNDFSPEQVHLLNHVADLDRKLSSARFNVDQLTVGREAFMDMLTRSLDTQSQEPEVVS